MMWLSVPSSYVILWQLALGLSSVLCRTFFPNWNLKIRPASHVPQFRKLPFNIVSLNRWHMAVNEFMIGCLQCKKHYSRNKKILLLWYYRLISEMFYKTNDIWRHIYQDFCFWRVPHGPQLWLQLFETSRISQ